VLLESGVSRRLRSGNSPARGGNASPVCAVLTRRGRHATLRIVRSGAPPVRGKGDYSHPIVCSTTTGTFFRPV